MFGFNRCLKFMSNIVNLTLLIMAVCMMSAPAMAQTPEDSFGDAVFGDGRAPGAPDPDSICVRLNGIDEQVRSAGTQDLVDRCNELAPGQDNRVLRQVAAEETSSQASSSIELSNSILASRIAALKAGTKLGFFSLNTNDDRRLLLAARQTGDEIDQPLAGSYYDDSYAMTDVHQPGIMSLGIIGQNDESSITDFGRMGVFINGRFSFGDKDETSNEAGFDFDTYGVTGGIDYRFTDNFFAGLAFTYVRSDIDLDPGISLIDGSTTFVDRGNIDSDAFTFSLYSSLYVLQQFYIDGIFNIGWINYDITRNINYDIVENVDVTTDDDTDAFQVSFSLRAGYEYSIEGLTISPYGQINYLNLDIDGYTEGLNCQGNGAGGVTNPGCGWALRYQDQNIDSFTTVLGGQVAYAISTTFGVLLPQVVFDWTHEFDDDERTITASFISDPEAESINFTNDRPDRDFFNLGLGLSSTFPHGISAFFFYETVLGLDDYDVHSFILGLRAEI